MNEATWHMMDNLCSLFTMTYIGVKIDARPLYLSHVADIIACLTVQSFILGYNCDKQFFLPRW